MLQLSTSVDCKSSCREQLFSLLRNPLVEIEIESGEAIDRVVRGLMMKDDGCGTGKSCLVRGECKEASLIGMCEKVMCGFPAIIKPKVEPRTIHT